MFYAGFVSQRRSGQRDGTSRRIAALGFAVSVAASEALKIAAGYSQMPSTTQAVIVGIASVSAGCLGWLAAPAAPRLQKKRTQVAI